MREAVAELRRQLASSQQSILHVQGINNSPELKKGAEAVGAMLDQLQTVSAVLSPTHSLQHG